MKTTPPNPEQVTEMNGLYDDFCFCTNCEMTCGSLDCQDVLYSDGITMNEDKTGCGFPKS